MLLQPLSKPLLASSRDQPTSCPSYPSCRLHRCFGAVVLAIGLCLNQRFDDLLDAQQLDTGEMPVPLAPTVSAVEPEATCNELSVPANELSVPDEAWHPKVAFTEPNKLADAPPAATAAKSSKKVEVASRHRHRHTGMHLNDLEVTCQEDDFEFPSLVLDCVIAEHFEGQDPTDDDIDNFLVALLKRMGPYSTKAAICMMLWSDDFDDCEFERDWSDHLLCALEMHLLLLMIALASPA